MDSKCLVNLSKIQKNNQITYDGDILFDFSTKETYVACNGKAVYISNIFSLWNILFNGKIFQKWKGYIDNEF